MRIAVFTNQYPAKLCTFFSRDIRGLLEYGIEIDIYPIYPLDPELWQYVPEILNEDIFPRSKVHHITIQESLIPTARAAMRKPTVYIKDLVSILFSAAHYGFLPVAKSLYAALKAGAWAQQKQIKCDHILAYWGNYAATSAYLFHRLTNNGSGYSLFLHAGTDLYRDQVYLKQKLLYADHIFVVCDFNRRFIKSLYPEIYTKIDYKIHIHHLGLDIKNFPFSLENRIMNKIIAVGSLTKLKGFDYLLHAVKVIDSRGIEVSLDLIGDGEEREALESLALELRIAERVKFFGWLPFNEVKPAISHATILVHPSPDIGDAVPTVIKEAMTLGTPVVASNIAGIPELLDQGRCGELVPPKDIEALANAIQKLIQNRSLQEQYAEAGRKYAEKKFDLWKNGQQLARILYSTKRPKK